MNAPATVPPTLPSTSVALRSPRGTECGRRYFMGGSSAADLRKTGKSLGLKGSALNDYVNNALTDESAARAASVAATVSALASKGFVADTVDVRKATATIRFAKPAAPKVDDGKTALEAKVKELEAKLAALTSN